MTVVAIRERLRSYVEGADDRKIKALYTLLQNEIEDSESFTLSTEQAQIIEEEHRLHVAGKTRSYNWEEAKDIIRGSKTK